MAVARRGEENWEWPFSRGDLEAGLRRYLAAPALRVMDVRPLTVPFRRPAIGRVRGTLVEFEGGESSSIRLVVKEPSGTTRTGTAGAGRREVGVYRSLAPQLPVPVPQLIASSPAGDWLILEEIRVARDAAHWSRDDYLAAVEALALLHDRFWGLAEDLVAFPWLARPLEEDFAVHQAAADQAMERFSREAGKETASGDRIRLLERLTAHAAEVAAPLRRESSTLLHGDYWPGNIGSLQDGTQSVYDWQLAGVGPGIMDLLVFVTKSEWWFADHVPSSADLVRGYRDAIARRVEFTWEDAVWDELWDHALMWRFLQEWLDLLAASPAPVRALQAEQLDQVWLRPVARAVDRRLGGG
ncbi:MAG: phosphotransferase [Anaerolineales bacterium]